MNVGDAAERRASRASDNNVCSQVLGYETVIATST
jgi:hypothetical protein